MKTLILLGLVAYVYGQGQNLCGTRTDTSTIVFVDDPSNCASYLWCNFNSDNILVSVHQAQCPDGFLFNPTAKACDGNQECTAACELNEATILVADSSDTNCRTYFKCTGTTADTANKFTCTAPSVFNRNFGVCTHSSIAPCSGSSGGGGGTVTCDPADEGFINDPKACEDFIFCNNGAASSGSCPNNLHFNPNGNFCDLPENLNPPCENTAATNKIVIPRPPLINIGAAKRKTLMKGL